MRPVRRIVVLGCGPAGAAAAWRLARRGDVEVTVLERQGHVGGAAASFSVAGQPVDLGSHRLHPSCDPEILRDLRHLLADDLLERPRHGRIRLAGRWIQFPLRPLDLGLRLPPSFALGVGLDALRRLSPWAGKDGAPESFQTVLEHGLGRTICNRFYLPYARKIWGLDPRQLSPVQARRRVAAGSLSRLVAKVLSALPGVGNRRGQTFFYPRRGFGQITEVLTTAADAAGARLELSATVERVARRDDGSLQVTYRQGGEGRVTLADQVWSTIPIGALVPMLEPSAPETVTEAVGRLESRSMVLVYLVLDEDRFSAFDAHYFPELALPFSRISEPKIYRDGREPAGQTVLCAEMPCSYGDDTWNASDEELGQLVADGLEAAELPLPRAPILVETRRLRHAYPLYRTGYEQALDTVERWLETRTAILGFGRQGLFAHDNTHHTIFMAYAAERCLGPDGQFDRDCWRAAREVFATHVVED